MTTNLPRPTQAQTMIMRVSPEGRALAQQERERRQRATTRLTGRIALSALIVVLATWFVDVEIVAVGGLGIVAAMVLFLIACGAIIVWSRDRPTAIGDVARSPLPRLPAAVDGWLAEQRPSLPASALPLVASLSQRLDDLAPQLATLDANGPAANAVRRLLATDLPALVRGYQDVPPSLRSRADGDGQSADAHLVHGLTVVDGEIGRMTEQLARGAFDELATQNRFLDLKYQDGGALG